METYTKLPRAFLCSILMLMISISFCCAASSIAFENVNLSKASQAGKKIMVSFSADWCLPCKHMEETLYADAEIASLVNENFMPIKADMDSELGKQWNELYNANYLPTILFADASGIEFERISKAPSRTDFLLVLNRVIAIKAVPYRAHNHSGSSSPHPVPVRKVNAVPASQSHSIQLGAFSSFENASKRVGQLATLEEVNLIIVKELNKNGQQLYKVVHANLASDQEAESKMRVYRKQGFECFLR